MARSARIARGARAACALLLLGSLAYAKHDDDFAFDNSEEYQVEITNNTEGKDGLKRLWGVPDTSAYAGHLFRMEIPNEAFSGDVVAYKVRSADGRRAPSWLAVDSRHGLISGVPLAQDVGAHTLKVTAHAHHHTATDTFTIEVRKQEDKPHSKYGTCGANESKMALVILLEARFHHIKPKQRIRALMELAKFMALDGGEFSIDSFKSYSGSHTNQTVVMSGPGSSQKRYGEAATTAIYLNVGCAGKLWSRHKVLVAGLREQARDGSLSHILQLPVLGWRLLTEKPRITVSHTRNRRQLTEEGSGVFYDNEDNDEGDYSGYDDDDEGDYDFSPGVEAVTPATPPPAPSPRTHLAPLQSPHPHRHHHGEPPDIIPYLPDITSVSVSSTEKMPTMEPTTVGAIATSAVDIDIVPSVEGSLTEVEFSHPELLEPTIEDRTSTIAESKSSIEDRPPTTVDEISSSTEAIPSSPSSPAATTPSSTTTSPPPPPPPARTEPTPAPPREDTTPPATPTHTTNAITEESDKKLQIIPNSNIGVTPTLINATQPSTRRRLEDPVIIVPDNSISSTEPAPTVLIQASKEPTEAITTPAEPPVTVTVKTTVATPMTVPSGSSTTTTATIPPTDTTVEETTVTKQDIPASTERTSTIIGRTTETIDFSMPSNHPPQLRNHMRKLAVTAGKAFRYIIPVDLFTDAEDGTNLTYTMYEADNAPLKPTSWVQFLPTKKEVYGLPLEEHVSRWPYTVQAMDSAGATARGPLDITVQHHKGRRTVNHEFSLRLKIQHKYTIPINWQIRVLEGLVNLFRDTDMDHMTVRNVSSHDDLVEFVWTNDTLPKDVCPTADIDRLMSILESPTEKGSPSASLSRVMSPELKVSAVSWYGVGACAATAAPPPAPPHLDTFPPVPRNQVDLVQATAGHLLVFKVPQDTFYDPEDGGTRKLRLSVIRGDRSPLPTAHWMQFDARNQEFYGLPTDRDVGKKEYQLIAEDSTGKTANDVLIVEVNPAPPIHAPVEFQMTMNYPYASLAGSALAKRTFVEKLAELFGDKDTASIRVKSITDKPTTVVWFNTSLHMDRCPNDEIEDLKKIIIKEEQQGSESLTEQVDTIFDKHEVMSIRLIPRGLCAEQNTVLTKTHNKVYTVNVQNKEESKSANMQEYLITFIIPAVVVVCMILIAGVIACLLYRRRRTGKMSVGDEEERQAFRSKGIPVIFQDELDEKPDPSNKSPVIMKEEKPPLLPPPDYKPDAESPTPSHHTPYRPPPPFTASRDSRSNSRPKATPTYRKPPPYVPP